MAGGLGRIWVSRGLGATFPVFGTLDVSVRLWLGLIYGFHYLAVTDKDFVLSDLLLALAWFKLTSTKARCSCHL